MLFKFLFFFLLPLKNSGQLFGIVIMATLQMEYLVTKLFGNEEGLDAKPQFGID